MRDPIKTMIDLIDTQKSITNAKTLLKDQTDVKCISQRVKWGKKLFRNLSDDKLIS